MLITRIIVFVFLIGIFAGSAPVNINVFSSEEVFQKERYAYHANRELTGVVIERYNDGNIRSRSQYENGLLNGAVTRFYPDGTKESERSFRDGEKDGVHRGWWPGGPLRFEYHFNNGKYDGSFKEWYANGRPLHHFEYRNGQEVKAIGWRENGKTYINFIVRNGRKYGLTNARLCFSLKEEQGIYKTITTNR